MMMLIQLTERNYFDYHVLQARAELLMITAAANTRVLVSFYFRLHFLQSIDELLKFMETWGFAILFVQLPAWK